MLFAISAKRSTWHGYPFCLSSVLVWLKGTATVSIHHDTHSEIFAFIWHELISPGACVFLRACRESKKSIVAQSVDSIRPAFTIF